MSENGSCDVPFYIYFVLPSPAKIFFCKLHNCTGKQEQSNQVGNCHKTVKCLCNAPHQSKVGSCAKDGNQGINNHKRFDHFFREQELDAAGTVKSPSDCCGKSEAAHGNCCKNGYPASICRSKSKDRKLCASCFP